MNANLREAAFAYRRMIGIGGIGSGIFFALDGNHTLGRNESRPGRLLDIRDYCKLHIISHYVAVLLPPSSTELRVIPIGRVGDDLPGRQMIREMQAAGIDTTHVEIIAGAPTMFSVCFQYPDGTGGNITASDSAGAELRSEDLDRLEHLFAEPAVALAAPEVPLEARAHFLEIASRHGAFRAASFTAAEIAGALRLGMFDHLDLVSLNEGEAAALAGSELDPANPRPFLRAWTKILEARYPELRVVVTAGSLGAFAFGRGIWDFCPAPAVTVASTAGAGDALLAGIIAATVAGVPLIRGTPSLDRGHDGQMASALDFAVLLASYSVTSPHTIHPQARMENLLSFASSLQLSFAPELVPLLRAAGAASSATRS